MSVNTHFYIWSGKELTEQEKGFIENIETMFDVCYHELTGKYFAGKELFKATEDIDGDTELITLVDTSTKELLEFFSKFNDYFGEPAKTFIILDSW